MRQLFPISPILLGLPLLAACSNSTVEPSPTLEAPTPVASVGVYLARGSLFHTPEFEQYRLSGSTLFVECGVVRGGRPQARDRHVLRLSADEATLIRDESNSLVDQLNREKRNYEEPGDDLGFSDPGQARITIAQDVAAQNPRITEIKTSVDEVASQSKNSPLRRTVVAIRTIARETLSSDGSGGTICDNPTFYGIE